jgi:hypothetical protein
MIIEQYIKTLCRELHDFTDTAMRAEIDYEYYKNNPNTLNIGLHVMKLEVDADTTWALMSTSPYFRRWAELTLKDQGS